MPKDVIEQRYSITIESSVCRRKRNESVNTTSNGMHSQNVRHPENLIAINDHVDEVAEYSCSFDEEELEATILPLTSNVSILEDEVKASHSKLADFESKIVSLLDGTKSENFRQEEPENLDKAANGKETVYEHATTVLNEGQDDDYILSEQENIHQEDRVANTANNYNNHDDIHDDDGHVANTTNHENHENHIILDGGNPLNGALVNVVPPGKVQHNILYMYMLYV